MESETPAWYMRRARELETSSSKPPTPVAILSSFSASFLKPYLVVEADRSGFAISPWFGPFNQFEQLLLVEDSQLWRHQPGVVWLALRLEDVDRYLPLEAAELGPDGVAQRLATVRRRIVSLAETVRARSTATVLVSNLHFFDQLGDQFDASNPDGFGYLLAAENRSLARDLLAIGDAHVFDHQAAIGEIGAERFHDARLWYAARAGASTEGHISLARRLARTMAALRRPAAKCIVVDLDHTLWGGVLGEDGPGGIQIGDSHPGNIFRDVQAVLLAHRRRGALLAIASKNDAKDVEEALRLPEMILRPEHFACIEVSWDPKPLALRRIAKKLNIGLDALLFVDDNPVERASVRAELPMVHVVELPPEPIGYLAALRATEVLDRPRLLADDLARASMYQDEGARNRLADVATSLGEFLAQLEMRAEVGTASAATMERLHQLIQKTNQFNLTSRRHSLGAIAKMAESADARVGWLRLSDRFGEMGLVCVGIVKRLDDSMWEVDTLLMSCRVMGRGVEDSFLAYLIELAVAGGARRLRGVFRTSPKNEPVVDFYPKRGFTVTGTSPDGDQWFEIDLPAPALGWPEHIHRTEGAT